MATSRCRVGDRFAATLGPIISRRRGPRHERSDAGSLARDVGSVGARLSPQCVDNWKMWSTAITARLRCSTAAVMSRSEVRAHDSVLHGSEWGTRSERSQDRLVLLRC